MKAFMFLSLLLFSCQKQPLGSKADISSILAPKEKEFEEILSHIKEVKITKTFEEEKLLKKPLEKKTEFHKTTSTQVCQVIDGSVSCTNKKKSLEVIDKASLCKNSLVIVSKDYQHAECQTNKNNILYFTNNINSSYTVGFGLIF